MKFGLKKFDVTDESLARFEMPDLGDGACLIVRPATEANKPFFNQSLKRSRRLAKAIRRGHIDARMAAENREEDRELYPKYVIADWENITDENGDMVPFSQENCEDFVQEMPPWMFDELRGFASEISNFFEVMDVRTKIKN